MRAGKMHGSRWTRGGLLNHRFLAAIEFLGSADDVLRNNGGRFRNRALQPALGYFERLGDQVGLGPHRLIQPELGLERGRWQRGQKDKNPG